MRGDRKMILKYDNETERYNDLHCGAILKIKIDNKWVNVRIEYTGNFGAKEGWYFIDENGFTKKCYTLEGCEIDID